MTETRDASITESLDRYMKAFNASDLDRVMTCFAEDAEYRPGNGAERVGQAAIREELEPQFGGALGAMRFDEHERFVDERARKAVIRWVCRHDLVHGRFSTPSRKLQRLLVGALFGNRFGWEGVDVLHFDDAGMIKRKFTYANYWWPRLVRGLGVALSPAGGRAGAG